MALRTIVQDGDPILKKKCRPVTNFDDRLAELLERGFYGGEPMPALSGKTARGLRRLTFLALQRRLLPDAHTLSRIKQRLPAGWSCR